jgi:hypothetical protein
MPSPHLDRKAREALGEDAGQELGAVIDRIDPIRGDIAELRHALAAEQAAIRKDMAEGFAALRVQIADVRADLMRWSFGFWVGAALAIAALAGVPRWTS